MTEKLDELDLRILQVLQKDTTIPVVDLAEEVGSSKSGCWRRSQKLVDSGVIRERVAVIDPHQIGLNVMVFAQVKMGGHGKDLLPNFVEAIRRYPQVVECHTLMGEIDFLLKVIVRDIEEYENLFWQELSQIEGVREINSSISLTSFVDTRRLPLDSVALTPA
jgi:Lrp/AsnC family transcriptional regulator